MARETVKKCKSEGQDSACPLQGAVSPRSYEAVSSMSFSESIIGNNNPRVFISKTVQYSLGIFLVLIMVNSIAFLTNYDDGLLSYPLPKFNYSDDYVPYGLRNISLPPVISLTRSYMSYGTIDDYIYFMAIASQTLMVTNYTWPILVKLPLFTVIRQPVLYGDLLAMICAFSFPVFGRIILCIPIWFFFHQLLLFAGYMDFIGFEILVILIEVFFISLIEETFKNISFYFLLFYSIAEFASDFQPDIRLIFLSLLRFNCYWILSSFPIVERYYFSIILKIVKCLPAIISIVYGQCLDLKLLSGNVILLQLFILSCVLISQVHNIDIIRQAKEHHARPLSNYYEEYDWHFDYIVHKTNQSGVKMYWVRRMFSHSGRKIDGPKRESIESAYNAFYDMNRESLETVSLENIFNFKNVVTLLQTSDINFLHQFVKLIGLLLNINELYRAKAEARAYYVLLTTHILSWASGLYNYRELAVITSMIYERIMVIFKSPSYSRVLIDEIETDLQSWNTKRFGNYPTKFEVEQAKTLLETGELIMKRNTLESANQSDRKPVRKWRFASELFSVGAALFALQTLPSLTDINRIRNHLVGTRNVNVVESIEDIGGFIFGLATNCSSLFSSIYFACKLKNFKMLFTPYVSDEFQKLRLCHDNLDNYSPSTENPHLPYSRVEDYEFALRNFLVNIKAGAGVLSDYDRREKIKLIESWLLELNLDRFKNRARKAPMVLCLFGGSSVGKSSFLNYILGVYSKHFRIPVGSHIAERTYKHNPSSKFWDGCKSSHWAYILDDIAREKDMTKNINGASTDSLLDVCGNLPFFPNMPGIDQKGVTSCLPRLVMLTTNQKSLGASQTNHCPIALQRRVNYYITIKPRDEFAKRKFLDSEKAAEVEDYLSTDLWLITVEVPVENENTSNPECSIARYDPVCFKGEPLVNVRWDKFCPWFIEAMDKQSKTQSKVVDIMMNQAMDMKYCSWCEYYHCGTADEYCKMRPFFGPDNRQSLDVYDDIVEDVDNHVPRRVSNISKVSNTDTYFGYVFQTFTDWLYKFKYYKGKYFPILKLKCIKILKKFFPSAHQDWYVVLFESVLVGVRGRQLIDASPYEISFYNGIRNCPPSEFLAHVSSHFRREIIFSDNIRVGDDTLGSIHVSMPFPYNMTKDVSYFEFIHGYYDMGVLSLFLLSLTYILPLWIFSAIFSSSFLVYWYFRDKLICWILKIAYTWGTRSIRRHVQVRQLVYFIAIIAGFIAFYGLFRKFFPKKTYYEGVARGYQIQRLELNKQGDESTMPTDEKGEDWFGRGWVDNPKLHGEFTYSKKSSVASFGSEQYEHFVRNVRMANMPVITRSSQCNIRGTGFAFALDNKHLLINKHTLFTKVDHIPYDTIEVYAYNIGMGPQGSGPRRELKMSILLDPTNHVQILPDVVLIKCPNLLGRKDIRDYFHRESCNVVMSASRSFFTDSFDMITTYAQTCYPISIDCKDTDVNLPTFRDSPFFCRKEVMWGFNQCDRSSNDGESGTAWVSSNTSVGMILGIHLGSSGNSQYAAKVTYELLTRAIDYLDSKQLGYKFNWNAEGIIDRDCKELTWAAGGKGKFPVPATERDFKSVSHHAVAAYIEPHAGIPLVTTYINGKPKVANNHTTEMHYHITRPFWVKKNRITKVLIPNLKEFKTPTWWHCRDELNKLPKSVPQHLLQLCADHYLNSVIGRLNKVIGWKTYFGKVCIDTAVHGNPNIKYIDRMNAKSSAGWPIFEKKTSFMFRADDPDRWIPHWMVDRVKELENIYLSGKRANPVFTAHQKDEFISQTKYDAKRLRVFMGSPMDFSILVRMYFLSFVRVMQKFRFLFESAVAIVAQGTDWTDLHDYLTRNGEIKKFIAGDYKFFDKSMHLYVLQMAAGVVLGICIASEQFSAQEIHAMSLMLMDIINCVVDFDGTLIQLLGSNPSGHPLTVLLNCIAGCIYIRLAYLRKFGSLSKFNEHVQPMTYGDDNAIGIHNECDFTFQDMRDNLSDVAIYTTSDKQPDGKPIITIDELNFLKRSFLYCEFLSKQLGRAIYTAPIEKDSIYKILNGGKGSLSEMESVSISLKTALSELAFHDKVFYDELSVEIYECAKEYGLTDVSVLTQEQRLRRWFWQYFDEVDLGSDANYFIVDDCFDRQNWDICDSYLGDESESLKGLQYSNYALCASSKFTRQTREIVWANSPLEMPANSFLKFDSAPVGEVSIPTNNQIITNEDHIGDLGDFLRRPVKIANYSWTEGTNFRHTLYPFYEYLNTPSIKRKMVNYAKFKGDLVLEILVNANPFKYSGLVAAFKPLVGVTKAFNQGSGTTNYTSTEYRDISGGVIDDEILKTPNDVLNSVLMQRQHVMIYPQETTKCTMKIPFIWLQDFYPLLSVGGVFGDSFVTSKRLGKVDFSSLCPLFSTATASNNPITIEIFAYLENPILCAPTLQRESGEYDPDKPISSIASSIASATGQLENIPTIGPYATTASMAAKAVGGIASLFGFSNTNNMQSAGKTKLIKASGWTNPSEMVPMTKLSLDQKNELSIDQSIIGLPLGDETNIDYLCSKPFLAGTMTWGNSLVPGDVLCTGKVCPAYFHTTTFTPQAGEQELLWPIPGVGSLDYKSLTLAPATWVSQNFQHWKGDMKIKIKILCSQFHKGRLRFIFDPNSILGAFGEAKVFSKIIDLNDDNECEITIPYAGFRPFIETPNFSSRGASRVSTDFLHNNYDRIFSKYGDNTTYYDTNNVAGTYQLQVMTDLSAPVAADAVVCLWVSFVNNKFMCPITPFRNSTYNATSNDPKELTDWSYKAPLQVSRESKEITYLNEGSKEVLSIGEYDTKQILVSGGEDVKSIRSLLHRWGLHNVHLTNTISVSTLKAYFQLFKYRFPLYHGSNRLSDDLSEAGYRYCNGGMTYINYFTPAYVSWKGGLNWRFNMQGVINEADITGSTWTMSPLNPDQIIMGRHLKFVDDIFDPEVARLTAVGALSTTASNENFKRTILQNETSMLQRGGEISSCISDGVLQQMEATCPDYSPDRATPANQYLNDAVYLWESISTTGNDGDFMKWFYKRDQVKLSGFMRVPQGYLADQVGTNPDNQRAFVRAYCAAAPDFHLMGFLNVPTIYVHDDLILPEYDATP